MTEKEHWGRFCRPSAYSSESSLWIFGGSMPEQREIRDCGLMRADTITEDEEVWSCSEIETKPPFIPKPVARMDLKAGFDRANDDTFEDE